MPTQIEDSQLELHDVSAEERDFSKHYRLRDPEHTTEELVKINGRNLNSTLARSPVDDSQMRGSTDAITFCDADNRKRRKNSTSPSGSGTEADDESGPFLRGLPAPPARLRKGLKNETTLGTPSPLLTPSYLDDEKRRQTLEAQFKRRASPQSHPSTDEETVRIREKFKKRRRAELLRRITETLLFLGVGCSACRKVLQLPVQRGAFEPQLHFATFQERPATDSCQSWPFLYSSFVGPIYCTQSVSIIIIVCSLRVQVNLANSFEYLQLSTRLPSSIPYSCPLS